MTERGPAGIEPPGSAARAEPRRDEPGRSLYGRVLGAAFDPLPKPVRQLRGGIGTRRWAGVAEVRRGSGWLARRIGTVFGFPDAGPCVPLAVTFAPETGGERCTRNFAGKILSSHLSVGTGPDEPFLVERFGLARFSLALVPEAARLSLVPRRWSLRGVPMPRRLLPLGAAFETEIDGRYAFDITIAAPWIGTIVAYRGTLEPDPHA